MRGETISNALELLDDSILEEARRLCRRGARRRRIGIAAVAACLCMVTAATAAVKNIGGNMSPGGDSSGHGGSVFMSYAGPAFPLTALGECGGIAAARVIELDFSAGGQNGCVIRDGYTLANTTGEDVTVTLVYPYTGSLRAAKRPAVSIDGESVAAELSAGSPCAEIGGEREYLDRLSSWEDYRALLEDGGYAREAFGGVPAPERRVVVYELSGVTSGGGGEAPTLSFEFTIDYAKSSVLTYGFDGGSRDEEAGTGARSFFIPQEEQQDSAAPHYIAVLGGDIGEYRVQGYRDGGCERGGEIEAGAVVERYESTLGELLRRAARDHYEACERGGSFLAAGVPYELYENEVLRFAGRFGADYDGVGALEDTINAVANRGRVLYETIKTTVPANGETTVTIELEKRGSFDYSGAGGKNAGVMGYDAVTALGTTLNITGQRARLSGAESIEIIRQNFGFDPERGVTEVMLDGEHYYLEVRRKTTRIDA